MKGKILKIGSNDLYGNVDERNVVLFSCFEHTKYMNNYAIFTFEGEYEKKKLYYGSIHLKENSVVIFSIKDNAKKYIDKFILDYINSEFTEYKLLDISKMEKVELVSYNEMDYENLNELDRLSIVRKSNNSDDDLKNKKPVFLYFILFFLILSLVGLTIFYLNPEIFTVKYKKIVCSNNLYDEELMVKYDIEKDIKFDKSDKVSSIDVFKVYKFENSEDYFEFKENEYNQQYFINGEAYKYIDDELKLKLMYQETSIIDDYNEMLTYLKMKGYSCVEGEYEK